MKYMRVLRIQKLKHPECWAVIGPQTSTFHHTWNEAVASLYVRYYRQLAKVSQRMFE